MAGKGAERRFSCGGTGIYNKNLYRQHPAVHIFDLEGQLAQDPGSRAYVLTVICICKSRAKPVEILM